MDNTNTLKVLSSWNEYIQVENIYTYKQKIIAD